MKTRRSTANPSSPAEASPSTAAAKPGRTKRQHQQQPDQGGPSTDRAAPSDVISSCSPEKRPRGRPPASKSSTPADTSTAITTSSGSSTLSSPMARRGRPPKAGTLEGIVKALAAKLHAPKTSPMGGGLSSSSPSSKSEPKEPMEPLRTRSSASALPTASSASSNAAMAQQQKGNPSAAVAASTRSSRKSLMKSEAAISDDMGAPSSLLSTPPPKKELFGCSSSSSSETLKRTTRSTNSLAASAATPKGTTTTMRKRIAAPAAAASDGAGDTIPEKGKGSPTKRRQQLQQEQLKQEMKCLDNDKENQEEELTDEQHDDDVLQLNGDGDLLHRRLARIAGANDVFGYQKEINFLRTVIRNCMNGVDSNSVLLTGARGSGKSTLLEHCLDAEAANRHASVFRVNGNIDASETNALRSIGRAMDIREMDLSQMMQALREKCQSERRSAIIILDEFDAFCRRNQTLLYNLFDSAQKGTCICIIGLTTRLDCMELLEKRVKSRMNHTIIHLTSPFGSCADYMAFASGLLFEPIELERAIKLRAANSSGSGGVKVGTTGTKKSVAGKTSAAKSAKQALSSPHSTKEEPAAATEAAIEMLPLLLRQALQKLFSKNKSVGELKRFLISDLVRQSTKSISNSDRTVDHLSSLSTLELSILLIATRFGKHQATVDDGRVFNCNALVNSLHEIPTQHKIGKSLLMKALNNLIDYGLVIQPGQVKASLYLTEWTPLALNLENGHLIDMIKANEATLPAKLKLLMSGAR